MRQGERRQGERRQGERRQGERRQGERRQGDREKGRVRTIGIRLLQVENQKESDKTVPDLHPDTISSPIRSLLKTNRLHKGTHHLRLTAMVIGERRHREPHRYYLMKALRTSLEINA